jgi:adenosyl cobinamide kinase/adenosyl cobinamide phosphate guanylyltransferase
MKLTTLPQRTSSHVIVYGDPKTGKSTLASQLAEAGYKLVWLSIDNGHDVLYKLSPEAQENIDIVVLPDTKEFTIGIDTCLKLFSGAKISVCHMHGQKDCSWCKKNVPEDFSEYCFNDHDGKTIVVVDHISQIATSAMNFVCKKMFEKHGDLYKPEWDDFRVQGTLMDKLLTNIQQARYHVLCIAHTVETEMEDGTKKLVPQVGTAAFSRNVGKYFDHMIYCHMMNKSHRYGSSTTYQNNLVLGSRRDIAIEADKDNPTLIPFFDGTVPSQGAPRGTGSEKAVLQAAMKQATGSGKSAAELAREKIAAMKKG